MREWLAYCAVWLFVGAGLSPVTGEDCQRARGLIDRAVSLGHGDDDPSILLEKEHLYRRAILMCPGDARAHNNLGDALEKQGRYEEAISEYDRAAQLAPSVAVPWAGIGDIYWKTGRYDDAIASYERARRLDPSDATTGQRLQQVTLMANAQRSGGVIPASAIKSLLGGGPGASATTTRGSNEVIQITFYEGLIPFEFDKADITPTARAQLSEVARALEDLDVVVEIRGHTDSRGSETYNHRLSQDRAEAVRSYLLARGIPASSLRANGYGENVPLCRERSESCYSLNRRVEVRRIGQAGSHWPSPSSLIASGSTPDTVAFLLGFLCRGESEGQIRALKEGDSLRSGSDSCFVFFQPERDSYAFLIGQNPAGESELLFPKGGSGWVRAGSAYSIPVAGRGRTPEGTPGGWSLHFIASSKPIGMLTSGEAPEVLNLAIAGMRTRGLTVVPRASNPTEHGPDTAQAWRSEQEGEGLDRSWRDPHGNDSEVLYPCERVIGRGAWMRTAAFRFVHELDGRPTP